jgi:EvpB/VC_A0108, tail sheath N-terminal domain
MLHFEMSLDPEDCDVRFYKGPLSTNILVVGDFLGRVDGRPIEDRCPGVVNRENFDKVYARQKSTANLWDALRMLVENTPVGIQIEWMNASKEDLLGDFEDAPTLAKSGFYKTANPYNHQGMRPYSILVLVAKIDGILLRQLGAVGRVKNLPILVDGAEGADVSKAESRFVVPCASGAMMTGGEVAKSFLGNEMPPELVTCGGTSLLDLLLLTRFAHQVLHIDYRRGCPSRDRDAQSMTDVLNAGLSTRFRHLSGVSARISGFEWTNRPFAEATLAVTTPMTSVEDRIVLHFEYA